MQAAQDEVAVPTPQQVTNRDEQNYPNFIGNYSKGLPHNTLGEVNRSAYRAFVNGLRQGTATALEQVPLGGNVPLVNPLAGLSFDLEGTDSHQLAIPPFPSVASRTLADEAVELYWQALCRDVNFTDYGSDPTAAAAIGELAKLPAYQGVTAQSLFRGFTAGDAIGPYVSQLELSPMNYGPYYMTGQMSMYVPKLDYMTDPVSWLAVQNGQGPFGQNTVDPQPRFIRNGRDFAMSVHTDPLAGLFMSFYNAGLLLFEKGAPLNPGNPYRNYKKQSGFGTFGVPFFLGMMGEVATRAFKAVWYAKWFVHRALRPEAYGGLVHWTATGAAAYPLHRDVLNSQAVAGVFAKNGTYLLPQAFPEGSPQHPSYAQGHASMAGACATILKAAVDGRVLYQALPNTITPTGPVRTGATDIVTASADGLSLDTYTGPDAQLITVNGEIDKLASNIGLARNFAGIHWRSDYQAGLRLGEAVALSILRDQMNNYPGEAFTEFTITTFDGATVTV
ncbi:MAG TPA: vanadium-dependent haloperoxidase [Stellaceae bacterium]|nr:vanadium-dependent haloperoxidase [Stellaceae bacterium]